MKGTKRLMSRLMVALLILGLIASVTVASAEEKAYDRSPFTTPALRLLKAMTKYRDGYSTFILDKSNFEF